MGHWEWLQVRGWFYGAFFLNLILLVIDLMFEWISCVLFRTALIEAHSNAITASDVTVDMKHVATVSLDSMLKVGLYIFLFRILSYFVCFCGQVWSSPKANEVTAWLSPGPLNCVSFHPEEHLLAAGCWNGNVIMWNWLQNKSDVVRSHWQTSKTLSYNITIKKSPNLP